MHKHLHILILLLLPTWVSAQVFSGGNGDGFAVSSVSSQTIPSCEDLAGGVNANATICLGSSTSTLTLSNYSGSIVKWQKRLDFGAWSDINNTNATYSEIPVSIGTWEYRGVVETGDCGEQFSLASVIIVNQLPTATISGTVTICEGSSTNLSVDLTGTQPWNITYTDGTTPIEITNIISTPTTISVSPTTTTTYSITNVSDANTCSNTGSGSAIVTVNPLPDATGTINGTSTICQGETNVSYSVPTISNASSYVWEYSGTGATINGTSNIVTIDFSNSASSGDLTVKGTNSCGDGTVSANYSIVVNQLPGDAGSITGASTVCQGETSVSYSVPTISDASSYIWEYSGIGATINGTSNTVTIDFSNSASSGDLTVKGVNSCGDGIISANYSITVNPLPEAAEAISGAATVCEGETAVSYSVPAITDATSYIWDYSGTEATINGTTNNITVDFSASATSGDLTVKGTNSCGDGTVSANYSIVVNQLSGDAGSITGASTVCQGETSVSYSVPTISDASSYIWEYSGIGATINGTSNTVTIDFSNSASSGDLTVKGINNCGYGLISDKYSITLNPTVGAAGNITGLSDVCQGSENVSYSVPLITNATTYLWTLPEGAAGSSTTNSILVNYDVDAVSDFITVKGANGCGEGTESKLAIEIKKSVFPKIMAKWDDILICYNLGDSLQTFQWYKNGSEIQDETEQFCQTHKEPGSYFVVTTDKFGCSNTSNAIEITSGSAYKIFPNPTNSNAEINIVDEQLGILTISIINSAGTVVKSFSDIKSDTEYTSNLELSDILQGIYTVEFKINGKHQKYEKLMVIK